MDRAEQDIQEPCQRDITQGFDEVGGEGESKKRVRGYDVARGRSRIGRDDETRNDELSEAARHHRNKE